jgi:GTP-binding protein
MSQRPLRNVAIIAHVDHGKTTLVDKMILQAGLLRANQAVTECMLDSNALERERGITILAKNISLRYRGVKINLFDTPGHADFGGEVERTLRLADGVLLLVDAFDGPMPQTRFVLRKALARGLRPVVVVNKMDRPEARPSAVVDEVFSLMMDLGATDAQLDFPVIYAAGRQGWASREPDAVGSDLEPLFTAILEHVPPPPETPGPLQFQVASLDWSEFTGRTAIGRVERGTLRSGMPLVAVKAERRTVRIQPRRLLIFEGMERVPAEAVAAGDVCALESVEELEIGDTVCDPGSAEALPRIEVDQPTISMVFQVNDGPFAGREGRFVTSRQLRDRLVRETLKNVALRVEDTERAEAFKVSGRGVLHLGILIEEMRREGYEFCVGKPRVILKEEDGRRLEPIEIVKVDVPERHAGKVIETLGQRRAEMVDMEQRMGQVRLEFRCPSRGLIGLRTRLLNLTQGESVLNHLFLGYEPYKGGLPGRASGVMISVEEGEANLYALEALKDRGPFFIPPGRRVYEGMVVGEHCKENDIEVNVCRTKKLSNVRTTSADRKLFVPPHRQMGVEECLEYIEDDELVELTPLSVRIRKTLLREGDRRRLRRAAPGMEG